MTSRSLAAAARPVVNGALYKALLLGIIQRRLILFNTTPVKLEFVRRKIKNEDDE